MTTRKSRISACSIALAFFLLLSGSLAHAADSLSVTVTPPLFQLAIGPGESWSSSVKVVNNNTYDVTYYTQVVDFEPTGEDGNGTFIPLVEEQASSTRHTYSLASWLRMPSGSVTVRAGASAEIPFSVHVPENAEPGGHYGAILVGTQPGGITGAGATVKVSSFVSSLLFVRIKGDVVEEGRIREFASARMLYQKALADFTLRFENTGNTHLKPQGDIIIYNMWGKERGRVPINQESGNFGNVLPQSIRKFQFAWEGDGDPFDIGPYSAVVTLNYGEDGKKNVSAKTYFWVVPVVPVAVGLSIFSFFALLIAWLIRRYIRTSLELEGKRLGVMMASSGASVPSPVVASTLETFVEPLREGVIDLRSVAGIRQVPPSSAAQVPVPTERLTWGRFVGKYKLFFLFVIIVIVAVTMTWRYFETVLVPEKHFEIRDVSIREEVNNVGENTDQ